MSQQPLARFLDGVRRWATVAFAGAWASLAIASPPAAQNTLQMSHESRQAAQTGTTGAPPGSRPDAQNTRLAAQESPAPAASVPTDWVSPKATFALSREPWHDDPTVLWPGFLSGLRGFEHFYEPVGNPLYFESPFINTSLRLLYLAHDFPNDSQIGGGNVNVYAAQVRVALTDRFAFIATKDGWSDLNARVLPSDEGWNDFAIGVKYALLADPESDFVLTSGLRWEWSNGDIRVLQGNTDELSPFISFAKGWDQLHLLGDVSARFPVDQDEGNNILQWDLHLDYEIAPESLPGFAPMIEIHGLHYLSDGEKWPLSVGGYDYTNLGSMDVSGSSVISAGLGFRWKLNPHASIGSTWAFPLHSNDGDIMGNRFTFDLILGW